MTNTKTSPIIEELRSAVRHFIKEVNSGYFVKIVELDCALQEVKQQSSSLTAALQQLSGDSSLAVYSPDIYVDFGSSSEYSVLGNSLATSLICAEVLSRGLRREIAKKNKLAKKLEHLMRNLQSHAHSELLRFCEAALAKPVSRELKKVILAQAYREVAHD